MDMSGLAANLIVTVGMLTSVVGSPSVTVVGKKIPSYVLAFSLLNVRSIYINLFCDIIIFDILT